MGWFSKAKKVEQAPEPSPLETLQAEIAELQAANVEALGQLADLQAAIEAAEQERDSIRSEMDESLAAERQKHAEAIDEMTRRHSEFMASQAELQQKLQLLDEANVAMAKMLQERDHQVEALQKEIETGRLAQQSIVEQKEQQTQSLDAELVAKSAQIVELTQQLNQAKESVSSKIWELEQRLTTESNKSATRIAELEQQIKSNEGVSTKIADLEKRLSADAATAAARIAQLEQQLAESEKRSANRAEQRSALLRNMVEIHRLSTTSAKSDVSPESLKLVNSEWSEKSLSQAESPASNSVAPSPFFGRPSAWNETSDSESA